MFRVKGQDFNLHDNRLKYFVWWDVKLTHSLTPNAISHYWV